MTPDHTPDHTPGDGNDPMNEITREDFCARFKVQMMKAASVFDGTPEELADYADEAGPAYFEDAEQRAEGPEECADSDVSYWEEDA